MSIIKRQNAPVDYVNEFFNLLASNATDDSTISTSLWKPSVDIQENKNEYVVHADLPGVEKKDLDVSLENNILTIKGERKFENKEKEEGFSRIERFQGQFYRRFALPEAIDAQKIKADYKKGVLSIKIPKRVETQTKKIDVNHGD